MDSENLSREQIARLKANIAPTILFLRNLQIRMRARGFCEIDKLWLYTALAVEPLEALHRLLNQLDELQSKADPFDGAKSKREWKRQNLDKADLA